MLPTGALVAVPPPGVPIDVGADEARDLARRELSRAVYDAARPSPVQRVISWLGERIADLLALADTHSPGGVGGLLVLLAVLVVAVVLVRRRLGRSARAARVSAPLFDAAPRSADDHRRTAVEHEQAGRYEAAVREWMRALVRGLEERTLLEPRPGRTAAEAAAETAGAVPAAAVEVTAAARRFDETVYGGRPADTEAVRVLRAADDAARAARPAGVA